MISEPEKKIVTEGMMTEKIGMQEKADHIKTAPSSNVILVGWLSSYEVDDDQTCPSDSLQALKHNLRERGFNRYLIGERRKQSNKLCSRYILWVANRSFVEPSFFTSCF